MTVAQKHTFFIGDMVIGVRFVIVINRAVFPVSLKAGGKFAGGIYVAKYNLGQSRSAFLAGVPGLNQGRGFVHPLAHVGSAARGNHHNNVLVIGQRGFDQRVLIQRQLEGSVIALAFIGGIKTCANHHRVRVRDHGGDRGVNNLVNGLNAQGHPAKIHTTGKFRFDRVVFARFQAGGLDHQRLALALAFDEKFVIQINF